MKYHIQTILGYGGNCFQTAVACILELELDEVPHFYDVVRNPVTVDGWIEFYEWCLDHKLALVMIEYGGINDGGGHESHLEDYHYISDVPSPVVPGSLHSVVGFKGALVHDPNPESREYEPEKDRIYIIPLDEYVKLYNEPWGDYVKRSRVGLEDLRAVETGD